MSPSHAVKGGIRYRYYLGQAVLQGRVQEAGSITRLPAADLEMLVIEAINNRLASDEHTRVAGAQLMGMEERDRRPALRRVISRVEVSGDQIRITIDRSALNNKATDRDSECSDSVGKGFTTFALPFKIVPRGGGTRIVLAAGRSPTGTPRRRRSSRR